MRAWGLLVVLGGCSFQSSPAGTSVDAQGPEDAAVRPIDSAPLDGKVLPLCLGTLANVCVDPPTDDVTLQTQNLDTGRSTLCAPSTIEPAIDACVIVGKQITVPGGATVTVSGSKKLILIATDAIAISGTLDVASRRNKTGPAGDAGPCPNTNAKAPQPAPLGSSTGGGGGYGGSFGDAGNNGGSGANANGGSAAPAMTTTVLRGGCSGSDGGNHGGGFGAGGRGRGGGAVMLLAGKTITIDGMLNASGGGGTGGMTGVFGSGGGGGGGGGSGGMIVLDAPTVRTPGTCFANGAGGGEAGSDMKAGNPGKESLEPDEPGKGGEGAAGLGGDGGAGAAGATTQGSGGGGGQAAGGGGGGGGGAGWIKIIATTQEDTADLGHVSPAPR